MTLLRDVEWEEAPLVEPRRDRELERWAKQRFGVVSPALAYVSSCSEVARTGLTLEHAPLLHVDRDLAALVYLVVSQDNSCRFCYAAMRTVLGVMGMAHERIRQLEDALESARLDARLEPALDFARRLSRANPLVSAADRKLLSEAGYSEGAIRELAFVAGRAVVGNRVATLLALPPRQPEQLADHRLLARLLRPLLAWRLGTLHRSGAEPEFLCDDLKRGPYTYLVLALDGLPAARALREALDCLWASPHTTPRAKALVFAVVARGLGCRRAEAEAFRLLENEGLGTPRLERILSDLAGPELDPVEAACLPYARETLWYEPASIQRRGRALLGQVSAQQLLELVATASLANMVGRLGGVLEAP